MGFLWERYFYGSFLFACLQIAVASDICSAQVYTKAVLVVQIHWPQNSVAKIREKIRLQLESVKN